MNYIFVLTKYYGDKKWSCGLTYDDFFWDEEIEPKPTDEHLKSLWNPFELELQNMRDKRNELLQESDFRVVPDYPQRDKWIIYRQQLRDLPETWTTGDEFPEPPE